MDGRGDMTSDEKDPVKISGTVASNPVVRRGQDGDVTSISFEIKAPFKGTLEMRARGDVAAAYWSVTPGMSVRVEAVEVSDKTYQVHGMEVSPAVPKD